MSKPTVYVDTNIVSIRYYRGADPLALKEQLATREWWKQERPFFRLLASLAVEREVAGGDYSAKERALADVCRLPYLPYLPAVLDIRDKLLSAHVVP
ncbi:MAG: hypothetical protein ABSE73_10550 [Planctomycetota bacterium]